MFQDLRYGARRKSNQWWLSDTNDQIQFTASDAAER